MEKLRIIVGGFIGLYPTGGAAWDYVQYPLGLRALGHDVYYIEDTSLYPVYQPAGAAWDDATACVAYLRDVMTPLGLGERWAYRDVASGQTFGLPEHQVQELIATADVLINVSCSTFLKPEYLRIPRRVLIDSDPMFTQLRYYFELQNDRQLQECSTKYMLENHNVLFSFGENIGAPECRIPTFGFTWRTTRQPVCLSAWNGPAGSTGTAYTSIMNWTEKNRLVYDGETWGQKDVEFLKFDHIPQRCPALQFDVVINKSLNAEGNFNRAQLAQKGWHIRQPETTVNTPEAYRDFIRQSRGEFSIAKETYVKARTGWFSCRSACYLAAGKPVVTQETGWSSHLPTGQGLFAFTDAETAVAALAEVERDVAHHGRAARELAAAYFDSAIVLTDLLEQLN